MCKPILYASAFLFFITTGLTGCKKETNSGGNNNNSTFEQTIVQGSWRVHYYFESKDETGDFVGYTFAFKSDSTANVSSGGGLNIGGTWQAFTSGVKKIRMNFVTNTVIQKLNRTWKVNSYTNDLIQLQDDSTNYELHFKKQ